MAFTDLNPTDLAAVQRKNLVQRLLTALPTEESEALEAILTNESIIPRTCAQVIKSEAKNAEAYGISSDLFDISETTVRRWRADRQVNGL